MLRVALAGMLARPARLVAMALAIMLGVGFVAGSYILTDTIRATFTSLISQTSSGAAVTVVPRGSRVFSGNPTLQSSMSQKLLRRIDSISGVANAEGSVEGFAQLISKTGKLIGGHGAPTFGVSLVAHSKMQIYTLRMGRFPTSAKQAVVDQSTFLSQGWHIGQTIKVATQYAPVQTFTLVGAVGYGKNAGLAGATLVGFTPRTAQRILGLNGRYSIIDIAVKPGVSGSALSRRVNAALGPKYQAITEQQVKSQELAGIDKGLGFFATALLSFAGIALFVGSFIIFNTFSIVIAQRSRELGLLRCIGASSRQVLSSVLLEALIIGATASVIGIGFGIVLAMALRSLLSGFGVSLPTHSPVIATRTIVVSLVVGTVLTLLSSAIPAVRALRLSPISALRDGLVEVSRSARRRVLPGLILSAVGLALLIYGLFGHTSQRPVIVGVAAGAVFLGVAALSPLIVRPVMALLGGPLSMLNRVPINLAAQNARRNPRRTASTASALMIGVALVSFVAVFAASVKSSTRAVFSRSVKADFIVSSSNFQPFSQSVVRDLTRLRELATVSPIAVASARIEGQSTGVMGIDPFTYTKVINLHVSAGRLSALSGGGIAVSSSVANVHHWRLGSLVTVKFAAARTVTSPVRAIFGASDSNSRYIVSQASLAEYASVPGVTSVYLRVQPGIRHTAAATTVRRALAKYPFIKVENPSQAFAQLSSGINKLLGLVSALLGLAVVIAFIGIVNTLALSVLERTREIGLLRAIGMSRRQVRTMLRWEAVLVSVLGAILGLGVGTAFGWAMQQALAKQGIGAFTVPVAQLVAYVVIAALLGVVAGVLPGRRASRLNVMQAVTME